MTVEHRYQLFPALDPAVEAALQASIERFGVLVPIVVDQHDNLLDGHHRRRIAAQVGVDCPAHVVHVRDEQHAAEVAATINLDRRHLDPGARRQMVADLRARGFSLRAIAGAVGCSEPTVRRDLEESGASHDAPDEIRGKDGKRYPASRTTSAEDQATGFSKAVMDKAAELLPDMLAQAEQDRADDQALADTIARHPLPPDWDDDLEMEILREGGALNRLTRDIAKFRPAHQLVADLAARRDLHASDLELAIAARDWLDTFIAAAEEHLCRTP